MTFKTAAKNYGFLTCAARRSWGAKKAGTARGSRLVMPNETTDFEDA
jgi:hypothetical protein